MRLKDYFPDIQLGAFPLTDPDWISIEEGDHYVHFPKASLSERERLLLGLGLGDYPETTPLMSPWYYYLVDRQGNPPELFKDCQLIYLNHHQPLSADLIDLLKSMIDGVEVILPIHQTRTAFLCGQDCSAEVLQLLKDVVPTIESDFGLALTIFVGKAWHQLAASSLRDCFEEENQLLTAYLSQKSGGRLLTFSEVMLWSLLSQQSFPALTRQFHHLLTQQKDMADVVQALWLEHGNLVQTAQRLYIHRNSLQYKLDKFAQQSGLHLKQLDDLAVAYLFLLKY
ncbi:helix-turn-helix domain-containing protein [Streptococcus canis]|uniref:helix-turn-helix domain-containing protein n=1 Tax=Streptococcus canis TaxID=1329 RepID=UPI0012F1D541|nr:helix-turn-helix domain-containing protein [Streptococcus canis]GFE43952.1 leucine-rich protein [Streptococcus canis]